jgi:hypothetical protein
MMTGYKFWKMPGFGLEVSVSIPWSFAESPWSFAEKEAWGQTFF